MVFCSISVYRRLIKLKARLRKTEANRETNMLKTLIGMNVFFFVINAPVNGVLIYLGYLSLNGIPSQMSLVAYDIAGAFCTVQNSFSIVVYLISNKMFRSEFLENFRGGKKQQQYTSSQSPHI